MMKGMERDERRKDESVGGWVGGFGVCVDGGGNGGR